MRVLGISAFFHDSAAALVEDGAVVAAAQEERFTRVKHDAAFPARAVEYCLGQSGGKVDAVVFYEKPFLKFERLLETYLAVAPKGFGVFRKAMPLWVRHKLFQKSILREHLGQELSQNLLFVEHHLGHAASAFYPSPFERAAVLTMDGVGEWATTSLALGNGADLKVVREIGFPHSLGLFYSAFTYYCGFKVNSGEYKLMGLAPYGAPRFRQLIRDELIDVKGDGSFRLRMEYFDYLTGWTMVGERFARLFGVPARAAEGPMTQHYMDVAASAQAVLEEVVLRLSRAIVRETGERNLCLAGGVALNCVANGKILRDGHVRRLWVQPAAGDAGGALGAALAGFYLHGKRERRMEFGDGMRGSYLGPEYSQEQVEAALRKSGAVFGVLAEGELLDAVAADLARGEAVGWFQGRMEFGPRSLGARSILADPRSAGMQSQLNLKIKYRESFRPFAPAVLREDVGDWFELEDDSPYMLVTASVKEGRRGRIPAVTHVDDSARIQTVHQETNAMFAGLLERIRTLTGCPVLVNTSFNVRGEPIVESPSDAYRCFMGTELDVLAVGRCYLRKSEQPLGLRTEYHRGLERD
jgi:carbamoyltransferase